MNLIELLRREDWDSAIGRISHFPNETRESTTQELKCGTVTSCLPIHIACMNHPTPHMIKSLIDAAGIYTLNVEDGVGRLPLHNALVYGAGYQVVRILIAAFPNSVYVKAADGSLPIHLACLYGRTACDSLCVDELFQQNNDSVKITDGHGNSVETLLQDNPSLGFQDEVSYMLNCFKRSNR
uniref:Uncharacterized protein n=1 Tax=Chaetoceros debilis TaxID=122233 RepID=A0A7S3QJ78_9STRA|eukprot:CAMPEP_0194123724 /NCGR_PEP_ID=MMETSP0150-20130528/55636_1 /TAXON_ID=122233 /ORGANISM="Chaetoceros debilis, Strain MM31A-1" /LENGTH=181 /DNA_ID=CAMNT_0038817089 /DNA_START=36 /DNA_END=581 /DNA_ORIENTATION=+